METIKNVLVVIYFIVCAALVILAMMQTKEDAGLSGTISGSSTNNFYEKNKGRTRDGQMKKWTIILAVVFAILSVLVGILYLV